MSSKPEKLTQDKPGFTPGKWSITSKVLTKQDFPTRHPHFEIGSSSSSCWIAHVLCFSDENVGSRYEANANLIAASPQLYEALEALPLDDFGDDMANIDAAEFVDHAGEFFEAMILARAALKSARGGK